MRRSPVIEMPTAIARPGRVESRRPHATPASRRAMIGLDESGPSGAVVSLDADELIETPQRAPRLPIVKQIARDGATTTGAGRSGRYATGGTRRVRGVHLASALLVIATFGVVGVLLGFGMRHVTAIPTQVAQVAPRAVTAAVAPPTVREDTTPAPAHTAAKPAAPDTEIAATHAPLGNAASALPPPPSPPKPILPVATVAQPPVQVHAAVQAHAPVQAHAQTHVQAHPPPSHPQAHAQAQAKSHAAVAKQWHPPPAKAKAKTTPPAKKPAAH
jgi:hypothetical protein